MHLPELVHWYWSELPSFGVVCSSPHARHFVFPAFGWYVPIGHGAQGPRLLSNVPGVHRTKQTFLGCQKCLKIWS